MTETIQRNFTGGELTPAVHARADLNKYTSGLRTCENFIVRPQGGAYSRPGFRFIGELDDSSKVARLIPFSFNTEQTYVLVFEHLKMQIIKDGAYIMNGGSRVTVTTPYTEAQLSRLSFTQSADVMTICHIAHAPRNLSRSSDTSWSLAAVDYASTVGVPGSLTTDTVGYASGLGDKTYWYKVTALDEDGVESLASAKVSSGFINALTSSWGVKVEWTAVAGADRYRVYKMKDNGTEVYGWIGDSVTERFDDFNIAPVMSDAPPEERLVFKDSDNYPSVVNYYQQRQIFANTLTKPQTVYTTRTAEYNSLRESEPARDDDAVTFTIAGQQVNEIRHIVSLNSLILLTSGGGWLVTEGQDEVLAPATVGVRIQTYAGSAWVRPVIANDTVIYVQEKGTKLRDLNYEFTSDKYQGNDLSIMASHMFEGYQIVEMVYADEPYGILWAVRNDGVLLGMTYQREHQVWGWHRHVTDGEFESVTSISEDDRDAVYVIVKRTIDGSTVRYVERMEPRYTDAAENAFCVDSGLSYDGTATTAISGLDHLEGEAVAVLADGNEVTGLTVASGAITLPQAASKVHVGLPYTPVIETLDLDVNSMVETLKHLSLSVAKVTLEMEKSRGGWVGPVQDQGVTGIMREIKPRFESDEYDTIALRSYKAEIFIEPSWSKTGSIRVEQRAPLPMAILSLIPDITGGG